MNDNDSCNKNKKKIDDKEFEFSINILELVNWLKN